ncbi:MAG: T9SS type A sorting domain-containing protein [Flavobacteriales bacterium]
MKYFSVTLVCVFLQHYFIAQNSYYELVITSSNIHLTQSTTHTFSQAPDLGGIEKLSHIKMMVYPNPANNRLVIDSNSEHINFSVKLVDRYGTILITAFSQQGICKVNTASTPEGLYFIKVEGDKKQLKKALVIDHR